MLEALMELLGYARKLLPLMELYTARRMATAPVRDRANEEFQNYAAEVLRANRADLMELRSGLEAVQQRLRVIDEQSSALQRETTRLIDQQRTVLIAAVVAAVASVGALIVSIIALARRLLLFPFPDTSSNHAVLIEWKPLTLVSLVDANANPRFSAGPRAKRASTNVNPHPRQISFASMQEPDQPNPSASPRNMDIVLDAEPGAPVRDYSKCSRRG